MANKNYDDEILEKALIFHMKMNRRKDLLTSIQDEVSGMLNSKPKGEYKIEKEIYQGIREEMSIE